MTFAEGIAFVAIALLAIGRPLFLYVIRRTLNKQVKKDFLDQYSDLLCDEPELGSNVSTTHHEVGGV